MISVEEALAEVLRHSKAAPAQQVDLATSLGHVLADDVRSAGQDGHRHLVHHGLRLLGGDLPDVTAQHRYRIVIDVRPNQRHDCAVHGRTAGKNDVVVVVVSRT